MKNNGWQYDKKRDMLHAKAVHCVWPFVTLMDYNPAGSSVHGILQARILERVAIVFSRGSSRHRDRTCISYISCIAGGFFTTSAIWEVPQRDTTRYYTCWPRHTSPPMWNNPVKQQKQKEVIMINLNLAWGSSGWDSRALSAEDLGSTPGRGTRAHSHNQDLVQITKQ